MAIQISKISEPFGVLYDEVTFTAATRYIRTQSSRQYHSDPDMLADLLRLAEKPIEQIFIAPPVPQVNQEPAGKPLALLGVGNGYIVDKLEWLSAFASGYPENDTVRAYWFYRPDYEAAPTMIYCHGWMSPDKGLSMRLPLSWVEAVGANLLFIEMPFHMSRTPKGTYNGELSITGDLPAAAAGARQAVADVRSGLRWLEQRGVKKTALIGKSMGGNIAALTTAAEPGFACSVLIIPAVGATKSLWYSRYASLVRADLIAQGISEEQTALYTQAINPNRYRPALASERILVISATADRACFYPDVTAFAEKWGAQLESIPLGHLSAVFTNQAKLASQQFLRQYL